MKTWFEIDLVLIETRRTKNQSMVALTDLTLGSEVRIIIRVIMNGQASA